MKRGGQSRVVGGRVAAIVTLLAVTAAGPLVLPVPDQDPQRLDFAADPVIRFTETVVPADDFRAAIGAAVLQHPTVAGANANTDAARARRIETRDGLFPRVDAQLIVGRALARDFGDRTAIVESLQPAGRSDVVVAADQLLFDFGATSARIAGASAEIREATAATEDQATTTALAAISTWYNLLAYQALADISAASIARLKTIAADTRTRQDAGLGSGGDVARAAAGLADAIGQGERIERQFAATQARYRELFGAPPAPRLERPAPPSVPVYGSDAAALASRTVPAVAVAAARSEAARQTARAARSDRLPRLSGGITGSRYDVFDVNRDYEVRGQLVLRQNFGFGGGEAARVDEARARARSAEFAQEQATAAAERDAAAALADARILDRSVASLGDAYRANRVARDMTVEQFRLSRGTLLDVLRVEQDYVAAASAYLQGVLERDLARYTLLARTGAILPLFDIRVADARR